MLYNKLMDSYIYIVWQNLVNILRVNNLFMGFSISSLGHCPRKCLNVIDLARNKVLQWPYCYESGIIDTFIIIVYNA